MSKAALPPILYEDELLVAFDKPAGLLVAPDRWDKLRDNLMDQVHAVQPHWFNAHRLDRDTSGVLICAKSPAVLRLLCTAFETHRVRKRYLALLHGVPEPAAQLVDLPLAPDPARPGRMHVLVGGKPAQTELRVQQRWPHYALVELLPLTGRSHQLRVHCATIGHPLVADPFYGDPQRPGLATLARTALHAQRVELAHPGHQQRLCIEAPLPDDFVRTLAELGAPSA